MSLHAWDIFGLKQWRVSIAGLIRNSQLETLSTGKHFWMPTGETGDRVALLDANFRPWRHGSTFGCQLQTLATG